MKKVLLTIFTALIIIGIQPLYQANAASKTETYSIFVDGKRVVTSNRAYIEYDNVFVPIEPVAKALNIEYSYNKKTKTGIITNDSRTITFVTGRAKIILNGHDMNAPFDRSTEKDGEVYFSLSLLDFIAKIPMAIDSETKTIQLGKMVKVNYFLQMNWGMSKEQVKKIEDRTKISEGVNIDEDGVYDYEIVYKGHFGEYDLPGNITYYFAENKLSEVQVEYAYNDFKDSFIAYIQVCRHFDMMHPLVSKWTSETRWKADELTQKEYLKTYENDTMGMMHAAMKKNDLSLGSFYSDDISNIQPFFHNKGTEKNPEFSTYVNFTPAVFSNDVEYLKD
jgi:hypothetical protein